MSECRYNRCSICGFAKECEIYKENAELKGSANKLLDKWCRGDDPCPHLKKRDDQLTKAKAIMKIAMEGIKYWSVVGGTERPFVKQAELSFNLFWDKAEQFLSELENEKENNYRRISETRAYAFSGRYN